MNAASRKNLLLIGASRGLGLAMVKEFAERGWNVVGTVRGSSPTGLHDLKLQMPERVDIETVDITIPPEIESLHHRLAGRKFDILFVNAGVTNNPQETIAEVTTEEFVRVMVTNALSPMRVIEALADLVTDEGTIGAMSSGQGSVSNNTMGKREVYRGSKAALTRSCAASRRATLPTSARWF